MNHEDSDPTIEVPALPTMIEDQFGNKGVTFALSERHSSFLLKKSSERGIPYEIYLSTLFQRMVETFMNHKDFSEAYYELSRYINSKQ